MKHVLHCKANHKIMICARDYIIFLLTQQKGKFEPNYFKKKQGDIIWKLLIVKVEKK